MKKALLVIDMLNDFINEKGSLYIGKAPKLISNISERIKEHRDNGNPIIYIMDKHLENDEEFNMFPSHCIAGEWGSEIVAELAPKKGDYLIGKRRYSAFFGT
ncbi:MAG: cysteine hydrolase, partial [Clostridia bacterium]|nr:cysteine hydrolase [Clostridia bacterium]